MVFFNTGWMEFYDGLNARDKIQGGGAFVNKNGYGWEIYYLRQIDEMVYGYVELGDYKNGSRRIHLERLGAKQGADSISDILFGQQRKCQE